MTAQWQDITSYDRYTPEDKRVPSIFELRLGSLRLAVLNSHIHYKGIWIMQCDPFYREHVLNVVTKEEAQDKALLLAREKIAEVHAALMEVLEAK